MYYNFYSSLPLRSLYKNVTNQCCVEDSRIYILTYTAVRPVVIENRRLDRTYMVLNAIRRTTIVLTTPRFRVRVRDRFRVRVSLSGLGLGFSIGAECRLQPCALMRTTNLRSSRTAIHTRWQDELSAFSVASADVMT